MLGKWQQNTWCLTGKPFSQTGHCLLDEVSSGKPFYCGFTFATLNWAAFCWDGMNWNPQTHAWLGTEIDDATTENLQFTWNRRLSIPQFFNIIEAVSTVIYGNLFVCRGFGGSPANGQGLVIRGWDQAGDFWICWDFLHTNCWWTGKVGSRNIRKHDLATFARMIFSDMISRLILILFSSLLVGTLRKKWGNVSTPTDCNQRLTTW